MKRLAFGRWGWSSSLAVIVGMSGCAQQSGDPAPVVVAAAPPPMVANVQETAPVPATSAPDPAEDQLENASGNVVAPPAPTQSGNLTAPAGEIVKLAQAGVNENVMMTFVANSTRPFNLSSDDIIYLNDIGVPDGVVTAMMQHDRGLAPGASTGTPAVPPTATDTVSATGSAPVPYPSTVEPAAPPAQPQPAPVINNTAPPQPQTAVSYNYFYDSLSPYGSWINIDGYGMCWQPTVVAGNPDWQPYCDRGHWINSDAGWYWASDYSWGWAPFHYGRWFRHHRWGWCWMPDNVWAPSWVSWRYTDDYCGWAPLPAFGFSVNWSWSIFVPIGHFCDLHPHHYRVPPQHVKPILDRARAGEGIEHVHNRIINRGIPASRIAEATHSTVRVVALHDVGDPISARGGQAGVHGRSLPVYRPTLTPAGRPTPAVEPARSGERTGGISLDRTPSHVTRSPRVSTASPARSPAVETVPTFQNSTPQHRPERGIPSRNVPDTINRGLQPQPTPSPSPRPVVPARSISDASSGQPVARQERSFTPRAPQVETHPAASVPFTPARQPVNRDETPKAARENRVISPVPTPAPQPAAPVYSIQAPRAAEVREQSRSISPPPERSAPARVESHAESRPAPAAAPSSRDNGSRGNNNNTDNSSRRNR